MLEGRRYKARLDSFGKGPGEQLSFSAGLRGLTLHCGKIGYRSQPAIVPELTQHEFGDNANITEHCPGGYECRYFSYMKAFDVLKNIFMFIYIL